MPLPLDRISRPIRHPATRALALAGVAISLAAACQSATNELNPGREALQSVTKAPLGQVLVDDEGRTMYLFEKDESDESYCTGACASVWPPVTTKGSSEVASGLNAGKVTLLKRDDTGLMQVAYNGHPLYYYQGDTDSEDTYGQEKDQFGAEWYAVTPSGGKAENSEGGSSDGS